MAEKSDMNEILRLAFANNWEKPLLIDSKNGDILSFGQYADYALAHADVIRKNVKPDGIVMIMLPNSIELAVLYLSCFLAGVKAAPIDPEKGAIERDEIIAISKPGLFIDAAWVKENLSFKHEVKNKQRQNDILALLSESNVHAPFLITYTSGSTGAPKGVLHSMGNLIMSAKAFADRFDIQSSRRFFHNLPMTYMAGILNTIIMPMIRGCTIVLGERFSVRSLLTFWEMPSRYEADTFWLIPAMMSLLVKMDRGEAGKELARRRNILAFVGTAPLQEETKIAFEKKYGFFVYESYGLSETLFVCTNYPTKNAPKHCVGYPLDSVDLKLLNDGELMIRVPWRFMGYLNSEECALDSQGYFLSGDIGSMGTGGEVSISDRKKDILIKGGLNLSPRRLETFLSGLKEFEECAVVSSPDPDLGEKIVCYIVPQDFKIERFKTINRIVMDQLGTSYKIDQFKPVANLPRNLNGKIDKLSLRKMAIN